MYYYYYLIFNSTKKYIVPILITFSFLLSISVLPPTAQASDLDIREVIDLLIAIGVIAPDKIPAINAYFETLDNTQSQIETVATKTYVLNDGGVLSESGYTSFMVKYPANWKYKEFSYNTEGIAFCPKNISNCGVGMMNMKSSITIYPYKYDMTGNISRNSRTHHNYENDEGEILASASLSDLKYEEEFEDIISDFRFINNSKQFSIEVLSPNGGEKYKKGDTVNIKWDVRNVKSNTLTIDLLKSNGTLVYNLGTLVNPVLGSGNNAPFTWPIPRDGAPGGRTIDHGNYKIRICKYPNPHADSDCDESDSFFKIIPENDGVNYPKLDLLTPEINDYTVTQSGVTFPLTDESTMVGVELDTAWCKKENPRAAGRGPFEFSWGDGQKSCSWFPATHIYSDSDEYRIEVRVKNTVGRIASRDNYVEIGE